MNEHSRSAPLRTRGAAHEVRSDVGRGELATARPLLASSPICIEASPPDGGRVRRVPTRETVAGPTDERLGRTTAAGSEPPLPAFESPCPQAGETRCVGHAVGEIAGVVERPLGRAGGPTQTPPGVVRGGSRRAPWGGGRYASCEPPPWGPAALRRSVPVTGGPHGGLNAVGAARGRRIGRSSPPRRWTGQCSNA